MVETKDPNQRHYFTSVPREEIDKIFAEIAERKMEVHLWKKGQTEDDIEVFEAFVYEAGMRKLKLKKKAGLLKLLAASPLLNDFVYMKVPMGKNNYLATSTLVKDLETKEYMVILGTDIFNAQQRSNYRLHASTNIQIQIKLGEKVYEALDISAGGTSIKIPIADKEIFNKGTVVKDAVLRFCKKNYLINEVTVAAVFEQKDASGKVLPELRLGLQFTRVGKEIEENLVQHVNIEARGEEIRKKFSQKGGA